MKSSLIVSIYRPTSCAELRGEVVHQRDIHPDKVMSCAVLLSCNKRSRRRHLTDMTDLASMFRIMMRPVTKEVA
jgi:hypothetical protein